MSPYQTLSLKYYLFWRLFNKISLLLLEYELCVTLFNVLLQDEKQRERETSV